MMACRNDGHMVLGYSPYKREGGILNWFIRFETLMTAIQYFTWATAGRSYMGVGRNLLYKRDLFLKSDPYGSYANIPYGDDDLFVQQASIVTKVNVCYEPTAHVFTDAPKTWTGWMHQKHRHMSAAHHYQLGKWWQPGLYGLALIMHWVLLPVMMVYFFKVWWVACWIAGLVVRWFTYRTWTIRLGSQDNAFWYPVFEVIYAAYLAGMGIITLLVKKKTWN
jgi:hypothetical protein